MFERRALQQLAKVPPRVRGVKNLMIFMYKSYCFKLSLPQYISKLTGDHLECLDTEPLISDRLITAKHFSLIKGPRLYRNIMCEAESSEHRISTESRILK